MKLSFIFITISYAYIGLDAHQESWSYDGGRVSTPDGW